MDIDKQYIKDIKLCKDCRFYSKSNFYFFEIGHCNHINNLNIDLETGKVYGYTNEISIFRQFRCLEVFFEKRK
jgi:hypothetical protein